MKGGDRPVGVEIVNRATGTRLPCELAYVGLDSEGLHCWRVDTPMNLATEHLTIEVLPPRTSIVFGAQGGG